MWWIDAQCHLDYSVFQSTGEHPLSHWLPDSDLIACIVTAIDQSSLHTLPQLSKQYDSIFYTLGLHPLWIKDDVDSVLNLMEDKVKDLIANDKKCLGLGEIGLDFYHDNIRQSHTLKQQQIDAFDRQLSWLSEVDGAVVIHCRKAHDQVIRSLRASQVNRGIVHAFNGSIEQATRYLDLGFKLSFGGAMTYAGARRIHALARFVPSDGYVIESDAPDLPPSWLSPHHAQNNRDVWVAQLDMSFENALSVNSSLEIPRIAQYMAFLRQVPLQQIAQESVYNTMNVFQLPMHCRDIES
ncbi:MAG: TatD family hydrolase [Alcaligenaceae bacterium]|nr:TatD family hydrolase [Alcaligenaceae bacterium]